MFERYETGVVGVTLYVKVKDINERLQQVTKLGGAVVMPKMDVVGKTVAIPWTRRQLHRPHRVNRVGFIVEPSAGRSGKWPPVEGNMASKSVRSALLLVADHGGVLHGGAAGRGHNAGSVCDHDPGRGYCCVRKFVPGRRRLGAVRASRRAVLARRGGGRRTGYAYRPNGAKSTA